MSAKYLIWVNIDDVASISGLSSTELVYFIKSTMKVSIEAIMRNCMPSMSPNNLNKQVQT